LYFKEVKPSQGKAKKNREKDRAMSEKLYELQ